MVRLSTHGGNSYAGQSEFVVYPRGRRRARPVGPRSTGAGQRAGRVHRRERERRAGGGALGRADHTLLVGPGGPGRGGRAVPYPGPFVRGPSPARAAPPGPPPDGVRPRAG